MVVRARRTGHSFPNVCLAWRNRQSGSPSIARVVPPLAYSGTPVQAGRRGSVGRSRRPRLSSSASNAQQPHISGAGARHTLVPRAWLTSPSTGTAPIQSPSPSTPLPAHVPYYSRRSTSSVTMGCWAAHSNCSCCASSAPASAAGAAGSSTTTRSACDHPRPLQRRADVRHPVGAQPHARDGGGQHAQQALFRIVAPL